MKEKRMQLKTPLIFQPLSFSDERFKVFPSTMPLCLVVPTLIPIHSGTFPPSVQTNVKCMQSEKSSVRCTCLYNSMQTINTSRTVLTGSQRWYHFLGKSQNLSSPATHTEICMPRTRQAKSSGNVQQPIQRCGSANPSGIAPKIYIKARVRRTNCQTVPCACVVAAGVSREVASIFFKKLLPYINTPNAMRSSTLNRNTSRLKTPQIMSYPEEKSIHCSIRMSKPRSQCKQRGGLGRVLREHKARLYIIRRCVVMLICHHDQISDRCIQFKSKTPVLPWLPFFRLQSQGIDKYT